MRHCIWIDSEKEEVSYKIGMYVYEDAALKQQR